MFIQRPDASLFATSFGAGPVTLMAIGGWIAGGEIWHDVFGRLPHWRCVCFDHRGSGLSRHRPGSISIDAMADDLIAVMDALDVRGPCVLGAESGGAAVALEAARRAPDRFAGLVLIDGSWTQPPPGAHDALVAGLHANFEATLEAFISNCLNERDGDDLHRWGMHMLRRSNPQAATELLTCRRAVRLEDQVASLQLPALLVHGDADRITPLADSERLAALMPRAELVVLPGQGHVPIVTVPDRVAELIRSRFDTLARPLAQAA